MREERKGLSKATLRGLRTKQRMAVMREAAASPGVSVLPANDDGRRLLKHPHGGGFPETGAAVWPGDRFTKRRIADGSVTREADQMRAGKGPPRPRQQDKDPSNSAA